MEHVFICGGSKGIGAQTVRRFSDAGYSVSFSYCKSAAAADELSRQTGAFAVKADGNQKSEVIRACAAAIEKKGDIDILIHSAGISSFELLQDVTDEMYEHIMNINVRAPFYYIRQLLPSMIHRHSGKIIVISSVWGIVGSGMEVMYSTSKAALLGMTKALAKEVGPSGITVNCIAPGVIDTEMNSCLDEYGRSRICEETPLGRMGSPDDIASLALYLCREGHFITGQVLSPNGGYVIY